MANETETRTGTCPTHGTVDATREVPRVTFPPLINAVRRTLAKRRPYRCPECNAPVS
ncbi:MAG TPA: hypothetical protein VFA84_10140 [Acidimicrobiales bacterium]|jgi:hypothetical protein|nr:hypothetical protein [Acidimicrobiales bacterium]